MNIYEFLDYKAFLQAAIAELGATKGYKARLAKAAGCQTSYLSQVLHRKAHLTSDHVLGLAAFWNLNDEETEYFLYLNLKQRAATQPLARFLSRRLGTYQKRSTDFSARAKRPAASAMADVDYYKSAYLAAMHMLLSVPGMDSFEALSARLNLPPVMIEDFGKTLQRLGLMSFDCDRLVDLRKSKHLERESPLARVHHLNFRNCAFKKISENRADGFHFTSVYATSRERFQKMKTELRDFLAAEDRKNIEGDSEDVYVLNVDLFAF